MWFIVILTLLSATLPQFDFVNQYRLPLGWAQLGVFEAGLAIGLLWALLRGAHYRAQYPTERSHPVLVWILSLFVVGSLAGLIGSIGGEMPIKFKIAAFREFISAPICIIVGYRLLA